MEFFVCFTDAGGTVKDKTPYTAKDALEAINQLKLLGKTDVFAERAPFMHFVSEGELKQLAAE